MKTPCKAFACPKCGQRRSKVVDMDRTKRHIRRRRECLDCGERWTTYEYPTVRSGGIHGRSF